MCTHNLIYCSIFHSILYHSIQDLTQCYVWNTKAKKKWRGRKKIVSQDASESEKDIQFCSHLYFIEHRFESVYIGWFKCKHYSFQSHSVAVNNIVEAIWYLCWCGCLCCSVCLKDYICRTNRMLLIIIWI